MSSGLREVLIEDFAYDQFANRAWLPFVRDHGLPGEVTIFKHILAASQVWVSRLRGKSLSSMPDVPVAFESLERLFEEWRAELREREFAEPIAYQNTRGDSFVRTVGDIARHALNHGTYHRGQLGQMFGAREAEFPETDFILFSFERDGL